jgi:hypothetical protein
LVPWQQQRQVQVQQQQQVQVQQQQQGQVQQVPADPLLPNQQRQLQFGELFLGY